MRWLSALSLILTTKLKAYETENNGIFQKTDSVLFGTRFTGTLYFSRCTLRVI